MVPRYARPAMTAIWEAEERYKIWFEIEAHATDKLGELGVVPESAGKALWAWWATNPKIDVAAIDAIEAVTKHDVIAFLTWVAEQVGDEARFMHQGMTSSDVLDTTLSVQLVKASDLLLADIDALLAAIKRRALEHKYTPTIGRSHGIHAEPTTFGKKLAEGYAEFARARTRLVNARAEIATCAISGAVGTFANIDPSVEEYVAEKLGLIVEPVSTQVIPRDRHAEYFHAIVLSACAIERVANEIRHLQKTEILELEEPFSEGQKGSSAMPHKRNPVLCENLAGLARLIRGYEATVIENCLLWHERDISHSSNERIIFPDAHIALDFMLDRLGTVLDGLQVNAERMKKNLESSHGLVFSQKVLLRLIDAGLGRLEAYDLVQRCAMKTWKGEGTLRQMLALDTEVTKRLSATELDACFSLEPYAAATREILKRGGC
jgi:adenylosuccinate lyase